MFQPTQKIGVYTLVKRLGRGGFGEVWLAERHGKFATTQVAVKLPLDEQIDHAAIEQEAQLWAKASGHPNVLPIIEADEYDGQIVIVSEYAPDGSLEQWLRMHGKMPVEKAVQTTIQILDGLEFLHSRNIIHRDLKPANILLQGTTPRLADFGISRAMRTTVASQSQNISGTFSYMSPEALDGKRSTQTDIWSVGVNLYQFLTGALPFPHTEPSVLITSIMLREFAPLPANIPQNLQHVITKALAKHPENRYKSVREMRADLHRVLGGESVTSKKSSFKETVVVPQNIPKKIILPKASPEIKTVVKPKNSNIQQSQGISPEKVVFETQNKLAESISTESSENSKSKYSPLKALVKLYIGGVLLAGILVLFLNSKYLEDYLRKDNFFPKETTTPAVTSPSNSVTSNTIRNYPTSSATPIIDESQTLVKNTLTDFADAIDSGDFDTFRANASKEFQTQFSDAQVKSIFKSFTDQKEDVVPILRDASKMSAKFSPVPIIRKEKGYSILVIKGKFDTTPVLTRFHNEYVYQDGKWKLLKIQIDL